MILAHFSFQFVAFSIRLHGKIWAPKDLLFLKKKDECQAS